jgi:hypothetical protein
VNIIQVDQPGSLLYFILQQMQWVISMLLNTEAFHGMVLSLVINRLNYGAFLFSRALA